MDFAAALPSEMVEKIFSFLQLRDLLACSEVCVRWYQLANSTRMWKPFASCWVPDSELRECDAITTNFLDTSRSLMASMPLSPLNPYKTFLRQRNFLKFNWTNGIYAEHCIEPEHCGLMNFSKVKVEYPSKAPQDCLYYPILGTCKNGEEGLYLIRLDGKPKIVCRLIKTAANKNITVCVMRDYVVWLVGNRVQYFDLTCELNESKVQTLETSGKEFKRLTMDIDYIIGWCDDLLYVWCKKQLELIFSPSSPYENAIIGLVSLGEGHLIIEYYKSIESITYIVEVYNIRNNFESIGRIENVSYVQDVKYSKNFVILNLRCGDSGEIQVWDLNTLSFKFSHAIEPSEKVDVINNFVMIQNNHIIPHFECMRKVNLSTGKYVKHSISAKPFHYHFLFDNILVIDKLNSEFIEVWDWVKNVRLYNLHAGKYVQYENDDEKYVQYENDDSECFSEDEKWRIPFLPNMLFKMRLTDRDLEFHVSETRVVTLYFDGKFKVYGFG